MSIRVKAALLTVALVVCLCAVQAGVLWSLVRPTFDDIERLNGWERMVTVLGSLEGEGDSLSRLARDWASWDDTYDYALTRTDSYEESNLVPSTFSDGELHFFAILDTRGRTIWSVTMDSDLEEPLDNGLDAGGGLPPNHVLMRALTTPGGVTGLVDTPQGPLLASAHPILTSDEEGPTRGVLIMGRRLDYVVAEHIPRFSGIDVDLWVPPTGGAFADPEDNPSTTPGTPPAWVSPLLDTGSDPQVTQDDADGSDTLRVANRLETLSGSVAGVVAITLPRRVRPLGDDAIGWAILVALGGGVVIVAVFWVATRRTILDPLARLDRHIAEITRTGDLKTPLDLDRSDEIGALARSFESLRGRIRFLVHNDPLTGLANRDMFATLAEHALTEARRDGKLVAVAFIDIDRFKTINDSLGQENGDALLASVARRLSNLSGEGDLVARYGGDEFLMLLSGLETPLSARDMASRLIGAFEHPFAIGDQSVYVTASLGLSLFPRDSDDLTRLISHANAAMNHAKALGRNGFQFFDGDVNARAREILSLEGSLRQALAESRLELRYQPQVDADTGRLVGVEALVRWNHPQRGVVAAEDFLPFVEQSGLHAALDRWVLETACRQTRLWRDQGLNPPLVAVNLCARHFEAENLLDTITDIVRETGVEPKDIAIEITETVMMRTTPRTVELLNDLRAMGFQVVIDDFGTGFASLGYLRDLPLDKVKIDKTFVGELPENTGDAAIVRAVLALAKELELDVLAEGVERQDQADWLLAAGCHHQQGYLHGHPLSAGRLGETLSRERTSAVGNELPVE